MADAPTFLVVAGEASGDLHAAAVVRAVLRRSPQARFFGMGGAHARAAGVETVYDAHAIAVMGITEVIGRLPRILGALRGLARLARERRPAAALLVDLPDFNLRLARKLKAEGIRVVYYVSPMVWAWRPGRTRQIAACVDELCCIYPFEEPFLRARGVRATYVGNPLLDEPAYAEEADRPQHPIDEAGSAGGRTKADRPQHPIDEAGSAGGRAEADRPQHPIDEAGSAGGRAEADRPQHPIDEAGSAGGRAEADRPQHPIDEAGSAGGRAEADRPQHPIDEAGSAGGRAEADRPQHPIDEAGSAGGRAEADRPQHPIDGAAARAAVGADPALPAVALLPGSRASEVERLFPAMLDAAERLAGDGPLQAIVPVAPTVDAAWLARAAQGSKLPVRFVQGRTADVLAAADAALVASGTATLETLLSGRPMVVVYRVSWLTWLVGRLLVRVAHVAIVNVLAGRRLVPELLQGAMRPAAMAEALRRVWRDAAARAELLEGYREVRAQLGGPGASDRVAAVLLGDGRGSGFPARDYGVPQKVS